MFRREIEPVLKQTVNTFPVTALVGPRQSGKTTILKTLFPEYGYLNLEAPDTLLKIQSDPRSFIAMNSRNWIIDEAQHYPELFSYLQEYIDQARSPHRFILSGSQNFLLSEKISQSLAGRVAILELLPLSYSEYITNVSVPPVTLWEFLYQGSYPRPYQEHLDLSIWYNSYIRTYIERDVRNLIRVRDLATFQLFLKLCAGRHGQLLNLSALANDTGISQTTASDWLSILEANYIIFRLKPHHQNFNKRLVKTPKLYFYDTSIVCQLLGIESVEHLQMHAQRGSIFEGFIITEIMKHYFSQGKVAPIYFWRDHSGTEVDVLIEKGETLIALEIKSTTTFNPHLTTELKRWKKIAGEKAKKSFLIYAGNESFDYDGINVVTWKKAGDPTL
jgi:predicted AAA+ superfamily ATPase